MTTAVTYKRRFGIDDIAFYNVWDHIIEAGEERGWSRARTLVETFAVILISYAPAFIDDPIIIRYSPQAEEKEQLNRMIDGIEEALAGVRVRVKFPSSAPWVKPRNARLTSVFGDDLLAFANEELKKRYGEKSWLVKGTELALVIANGRHGGEEILAYFLCTEDEDPEELSEVGLEIVNHFRQLKKTTKQDSERFAELEAELMKARARIAELEGAQSSPDATGEVWKIAGDVPLIPSAFEFLKDGHTKEELARAIRDHVTGTSQEFPRYVTGLLEVDLTNEKSMTANAVRNAGTRLLKEPEQAGKTAKKQGKSKRQK
ncbi:MAG: hypothetical protein K6E31_02085 [bacterium]|nr:hypothetical protein [bacterium]